MNKRLIIIITVLLGLIYPVYYTTHWYAAGLVDQTQLIEFGMEDDFLYCQKWRPELFDQDKMIEGYKRHFNDYQNYVREYKIVNKSKASHFPLHWAARYNHSKIVDYLSDLGQSFDNNGKYKFTIHQAAFEGHLGYLKLAAKSGFALDKKEKYGIRPLHLAADQGHYDVTQFLIEHGADINKVDHYERTALAMAASKGHINIVSLFLKNGSTVDSHSFLFSDDYTSMGPAINLDIETIDKMLSMLLPHVDDMKGQEILDSIITQGLLPIDFIKLLVKHGANINGNNPFTPLMIMVDKMQRGIKIKNLKWLIDNGAKLNFKKWSVISFLRFTPNEKLNFDVIEYLLKNGANPNLGNGERLLLHSAIIENKPNIIELLLKYGADPNLRVNGYSALHYALMYASGDIVKKLISAGADINAISIRGESPISIALSKGSIDLMQYLIEKGANINGVNGSGHNVLHRLNYVQKGLLQDQKKSLEIFKVLIKKGANPKLICDKGRSLLWATRISKEKIEYLLNLGLDIHRKDIDNETILHWAIKHYDLGIIKFLINKGVDINAINEDGISALHLAIERGNKVFKLLISNGAKLALQEGNNSSLLHTALFEGQMEIVKFLIEKGVSTNVKDESGRTILHEAIESDEFEIEELKYIINIFLHNQGDINAKDTDGKTALHYAAEQDNLYIVEALLDNGAKIDIKDLNGWSVLHFASDSSDILELLIKKGMDVNSLEIPFFI